MWESPDLHLCKNISYNQFPDRRRGVQAGVNYRMRKTRCDAAQPECGLCTTQNVDCVYRDARQPRTNYNIQTLLEWMQLLRDRIVAISSSVNRKITNGTQDLAKQSGQQSDHAPGPNTASQEPTFEPRYLCHIQQTQTMSFRWASFNSSRRAKR